MKNIIRYSLLLFSLVGLAQEKDKNLPKGNNAFESKNYADAEADYRISQSKFTKKAKSSYNLGNAIYKQKQSAEAKYQFAKAIKNAKTKPEKHQAFHNLGNCLMNEKDYSGAVDAYKNALRNNPTDEETRYNYALAKLYLKNNPPKGDGNDKDKNKDKDKKDDKKKDKDKDKKPDDQQKDKDKNDGKDPQDKNKEGKNDKDKNDNKNNGKPKENPGGMSKQRLESLLDAVNNEEKKVQDKVNQQKVQANPKKAEKDW
jgi:tetratricopeptide (TPR) repeat protein